MNPVTAFAGWFRTRLASALYIMGKQDEKSGRYAEAARTFDRAAKQFSHQYGEDHIWVRQAIARRAHCLVMIGQHADGIELYRQALEAERRLNGESQLASVLEAHLRWAREQAIG